MEISPVSPHVHVPQGLPKTQQNPFSISPEKDLPAAINASKATEAKDEIGLKPIQIDTLRSLPVDKQAKIGALIVAQALATLNQPGV